MTLKPTTSLLAASALALAGTSPALGQTYTADFDELNGSGVIANAVLTLDTIAQTLRVQVTASGLETGQDHLMHIHGLFGMDGETPVDSTQPDQIADDTDGDGKVEVLEALPNYGDILLPLMTINTATGEASTDQTFDLTDDSLFFSPVSGADYEADDLFPLELREMVIHGLTVEGGINDDLPDGGYLATLPVATAEIELAGDDPVVPTPAALPAGLAALALMATRRRRAA